MELNNIEYYKANSITRPYLEKVLGRKRCTDTTIPLRQLKNLNMKII